MRVEAEEFLAVAQAQPTNAAVGETGHGDLAVGRDVHSPGDPRRGDPPAQTPLPVIAAQVPVGPQKEEGAVGRQRQAARRLVRLQRQRTPLESRLGAVAPTGDPQAGRLQERRGQAGLPGLHFQRAIGDGEQGARLAGGTVAKTDAAAVGGEKQPAVAVIGDALSAGGEQRPIGSDQPDSGAGRRKGNGPVSQRDQSHDVAVGGGEVGIAPLPAVIPATQLVSAAAQVAAGRVEGGAVR